MVVLVLYGLFMFVVGCGGDGSLSRYVNYLLRAAASSVPNAFYTGVMCRLMGSALHGLCWAGLWHLLGLASL